MKRIVALTLCMLFLLASSSFALSAKEQIKGYSLNKKYCTVCHDSVADPEKVGHTRDTWHLIIQIMHKNGQEKIPAADLDKLIDYFYSIRKGMEMEAG